jgi:hypothetical protein
MKLVFLKASIEIDKIKFDSKRWYNAVKTKKEYLIKDRDGLLRRDYTDLNGNFHLKNKDFNVAWVSPYYGITTAVIWCEKKNLKGAKAKCIKLLKGQIFEVNKYIFKKTEEIKKYEKILSYLIRINHQQKNKTK